MKKKILSLSFLLSLFAFAGCSPKTSGSLTSDEKPTVSETAHPTDKPTDKPTEKPTEKPSDSASASEKGSESASVKQEIVLSGLKYASVGEQVTLSSNVEGVSYSSSDATVATVDNQGVVTALKAGNATITATKDGYVDGTKDITVVDKVSTVGKVDNTTGTAFSTKGIVLAKGNNGFILADASGRDNAVYAYGYNAAKKVNVGDYVFASGKIDNGDYGYEYKIDTVDVLSSEYTKPTIQNEPVIVTPEVLDSYAGKGIIYGIAKDVIRSQSTNNKKTFTNIDFPDGVGGTNKFSFDLGENTYQEGTYDVYGYLCAKTRSGNRRTFLAEKDGVKTPSKGEPTKITVAADNSPATIGKGETLQFSASVEPYYATKEVSWSVTGSDKATIDENGLLTIAADASAADLVITATTKFPNGTRKGTYNLKIVEKSISIKAQDLVTVGETIDLSATLSEAGDTGSITYIVDKEDVAQIVDGNKLKGLKAGKVTVTAKSNGYSDATYAIDVLDNITAAKASSNGTKVTLKGVVKSADNYGYILADATDYVYVYKNATAVKEGDRIKFEGSVKFDENSNHVFELEQTSATVLDGNSYKAIVSSYTAEKMDEKGLAALTIKDGAKYVSISSVSVASGSFKISEKSVKISGKDVADGFYDVTGYIYLNYGKYYRYVTEAKAATRPAATALSFKQGEKANIQLGTTLTLEVEQTPNGAVDELAWSVSENAPATVADGVVTLKDTAKVGDTFSVTAASKVNAAVKATIAISVIEKATTTSIEIGGSDFTEKKNTAKLEETVKGFKFSAKSAGVYTELRVYAGSDLTITPVETNWRITKIEFTCKIKNKNGADKLSGDNYNYSNDKLSGIWELATGSSSVVLNASAQVQITKLVITYKA